MPKSLDSTTRAVLCYANKGAKLVPISIIPGGRESVGWIGLKLLFKNGPLKNVLIYSLFHEPKLEEQHFRFDCIGKGNYLHAFLASVKVYLKALFFFL